MFKCPAATVVSKKKAKIKKFDNVSARDCSFRSRGITGTLLNTITVQIKKTVKPGMYHKIEKGETVEAIFDKDTSDEKIVFKDNSQMSDAEVVFYYIPNAFAHGDIEVIGGGDRIYKLESKKKNDIKAQMILKEEAFYWAKCSNRVWIKRLLCSGFSASKTSFFRKTSKMKENNAENG